MTRTTRQLLPGVEASVAPRWMFAAEIALCKNAPAMVRTLDADIDAARANSAALPGVLMTAITQELARRHDRVHRGEPLAVRVDPGPAPQPTPLLRSAASNMDTACELMLGVYLSAEGIRQLRTEQAEVIRYAAARYTDGPQAASELSWGGWGLLAALQACALHGGVLPEPGRQRADRPAAQAAGAAAAGVAFQLGRALGFATALELIALSESAAA
ncbi:hypothetical protein OG216_03665 [Streptomycetaceae bacterium NBC_01309]